MHFLYRGIIVLSVKYLVFFGVTFKSKTETWTEKYVHIRKTHDPLYLVRLAMILFMLVLSGCECERLISIVNIFPFQKITRSSSSSYKWLARKHVNLTLILS